VNSNSFELLIKTVVWRVFSMLFGAWVTYLFTGDIVASSMIVLVSGMSLTLLQWLFEIVWDKYAREQIRDAISRK